MARRGTVARGPAEVVRVWLLGRFSVSVGSRTIAEDEWRLKRSAGLVKLLSLAPGHSMHRERLIYLLWPEPEAGRVADKLRYTLHDARRTIDPSGGDGSRYLRLEGDQLALCPEGELWVDAEAFEQAAAEARRSGEPMAYEAAVLLYQGELLPEDLYEAWTEDRREQLRDDYLDLLLRLGKLRERRGELAEAIEVLRRALATKPSLEGARHL